jgi:hypothetical protein
MIFLRDNTLLKRDLTADDIKPRLLGEHIFYLPTYHYMIYLYSLLRTLGNMSWSDFGVFSPQLSDQNKGP